MPEYLSPGVYIEEIPSGLRAIEGVSTSTAAFVGRARRGTVPGYVWPVTGTNLPFVPTAGFVLAPDPSPVLVTSFPEFQREFGTPLPIPTPDDPTDYGYLGWAVKAFFDNGGKRVYIARVVDPTDTPGRWAASQGVVYRLLHSAAKTDDTLYLTSTRGLKTGDALTLTRHSDGQNALGTPESAASAPGGVGPFALKDGDSLKVTEGGGATVTGTWNGAAASVRSGGAATFPGLTGTVLTLQVGGPAAPSQTITFNGDAVTPLSTPATLAEVASFISRYADGVHVYVDAATSELVIAGDVPGTDGQIAVSGTAVGPLTLGAPTAGGGNVANLNKVTVAEIAAQLSVPGKIAVGADSAGALRIASVASGAASKIQLDENSAGTLARLGYGAGPTVTQTGAAGGSPTVTILSYDAQANSVKLTVAVGVALDPNDVSVTGPAVPTAGAGPTFIARSPGSWSDQVRVLVSSTDRSAVPILGSGAIAAGATKLKLQNVASLYVGAAVEIDDGGAARTSHQVTAIDGSTRQITIFPATAGTLNPSASPAPSVRVLEVDVTVSDLTGAAPTESYRGLSWNQTKESDLRRHYAAAINARSRLVWVAPPATEDYQLTSQPVTGDGFPMAPTTAGAETFDGSKDEVWTGLDNGPGARSGIESLKDLTEARIVAVPGKTSQTIQLALIAQCELLRYRFAILDGELDPAGGSLTSILTHRSLYDTSFAAYYQPWITVAVDGQNRSLPPSGFKAGVYARVDNDRGVWKAPANETVMNALRLRTNYTTGEQDLLNPRGVNLTRRFDLNGIRVWGARTLSSDPDVKYINVRRTLIFLEASIDRGTQWVVFEPNDPETWSRLTLSVNAFLLTQWRAGALFGRKPEQAFSVRCDESTMTADDILNGRLICKVAVAIVRPAEFVVFQIQQITNFGAVAA